MNHPAILTERAPAKINLSLHVLGKRADGYHDLQSLVAFTSFGDDLHLKPDEALSLEIAGLWASHLKEESTNNNLVLHAAQLFLEAFPKAKVGAFRLVKRIPVAAGLGGGSADAAAALRLLARLNHIEQNAPVLYDIAAELGSDVPVCLASKPRWMQGRGEKLSAPLIIPKTHVVLVNPLQALATRDVFTALRLRDNQQQSASALSNAEWIKSLKEFHNDLEEPACRLLPVIAEVKATLEQTEGAQLVRMSGSGASVFTLYPTCRSALNAAQNIMASRPSWWVRATAIA